MAKATFRVADANDQFNAITVAVEVSANPPDEWWQAIQQHIANNLPPEITWEGVHCFSLQLETAREVDPLPQA